MWQKWAFIRFTCWMYLQKALKSTYRSAPWLQTQDRSKNSSSHRRRRHRVWHGHTPCIWCRTVSHAKPAWCWPLSSPPSKDSSLINFDKKHNTSASWKTIKNTYLAHVTSLHCVSDLVYHTVIHVFERRRQPAHVQLPFLPWAHGREVAGRI